ncbi:MAG: DNA primase [Deltaproteobacteria bacterium]|jgi:DNA primase|nr:DNA primase [Deltaproteobacteria bacterium]
MNARSDGAGQTGSRKGGGRGAGWSGSAVQAIKDRLNIVDIVRRYVNLQQAGGNRWMGPCPFHQETKGSFSVNADEGFFYCFGCQAAGDIFDFYGRINGLDFKEALEQLAEEAGVALEARQRDPGEARARDLRREALKMHEAAKDFYRRNLESSQGRTCRDYLAGRQLDAKIVESFELGWSLGEWATLAQQLERIGFRKENGIEAGLLIRGDKGGVYDRFRSRLMFPIKNLSGQTIAFGGRIIAEADAAKYINSSDSPIYKKGDNLYGLFQARRSIAVKKAALLTEGYMDVLTLHQFGYQNACGVLGTALTPEQVKRLAGFCSDFELLFDGDGPGRKAALRACEMLLTRGLRCKVTLMPEGEDIDSLLKGGGPEMFENLRLAAPDGLTFCIRSLNEQYAPKDAIVWVKDFLGKLEQPALFSRFVSEFSKGLGFEESVLRKELQRPKGADDSGRAGGQGNSGTSGDSYGRPGWDKSRGMRGKAAPGVAVEAARGLDTDVLFLTYAVRNLHLVPTLRDQGMEFALHTPRGRALWAKLLGSNSASPEYDIFPLLDDKQKEFWVRCRTVDVPPKDEAKDALELKMICESIKRLVRDKQSVSYKQALAGLNGDDYENEFLRALSEKLTGKPLGEKQ